NAAPCLVWKPAACTASSMPASSTKSRQCDSRLSPMEKRGKRWRSSTSTSWPRRLRMAAAMAPDGPAPMTTIGCCSTSGDFMTTTCLIMVNMPAQQGRQQGGNQAHQQQAEIDLCIDQLQLQEQVEKHDLGQTADVQQQALAPFDAGCGLRRGPVQAEPAAEHLAGNRQGDEHSDEQPGVVLTYAMEV